MIGWSNYRRTDVLVQFFALRKRREEGRSRALGAAHEHSHEHSHEWLRKNIDEIRETYDLT